MNTLSPARLRHFGLACVCALAALCLCVSTPPFSRARAAAPRYFGTADAPTTIPGGSLDATFGSGGKVLLDPNAESRPTSVALQPDGKIVVSGLFSPVSGSGKLARLTADGTLDSTFGTGGFVNSTPDIQHLAIQSDGKILVQGAGLSRFNADGSPDTSFGTGGRVTMATSNSDLALQPDQKILIVGQPPSSSSNGGFAVLRYNADGTPDQSFGASGSVETTFNQSGATAKSVAIQPDGRIVVAGNGGNDILLARYNSDGSLDDSFGSGGKLRTDLGGFESVTSVALQQDGEIVVGGKFGNPRAVGDNFMLVRYNAAGSLDANFGTGGAVITPVGDNRTAFPVRVLIQSDAKIVFAANAEAVIDGPSGPEAWVLLRYNADGTPDQSFGSSGRLEIVTASVLMGYLCRDALMQPDGKIVAVGSMQDGGVVLRFLNDVPTPTPTPTPTATPTPTPTTIQFSSTAYSVGEGDGRATITMTRTGDTSGTSTVDVRTVDDTRAIRCDDTTTMPGVAFARCDYATAVGTLSFNAGETVKTFTVPVIDDSFVEPDESVQLSLSNPVGAPLGAQSTTTLVIKDNDAAGEPNPILSPPFFVRQQYFDFLSREPEQAGLDAWASVLNNCSNVNNTDPSSPSANCDRIHVSASFFLSQEFQLKGFFVFRFYKVAFGRLPHYTEVVSDMSSVTGSTTAELIVKKSAFTSAFTQRQEFTSAYGAMTSQQYVGALMNRYNLQSISTPDPNNPDGTAKVTLARSDLVTHLNAGTMTRAQVLRAVADSDEVARAEFNPAFVAMQYFGYLRRDPDAQGYNNWLATINANQTDIRSMVSGFINSTEYRLRFGPG